VTTVPPVTVRVPSDPARPVTAIPV
jgi:hypothetical protein